jgi:soluble lytic murein transglycosylase-like protein
MSHRGVFIEIAATRRERFVRSVRMAGYAAAGLAALLFALALAFPAHADTSGVPQARIWSPEILTGADRERYRQIFAATERGRFAEADKLATQLQDRRLMGHVLHVKYMGRHYTTRYAELRDWLAAYKDHPGAADIYKLALRKRPASAALPVRPAVRQWRQAAHAVYAVDDEETDVLSPRFREIDNQVRRMVRQGKAESAHTWLKRGNARTALRPAEYDKVMERIVASYFLEGENDKAYVLASEILRNHTREVPRADWYAGLAAWRMENYGAAARHFERLARAAGANEWTRAAGGFWAARAFLAGKQPEHVAPMLEIAADTGATFYGLLATRQLGRTLHIDWVEPRLDAASFGALVANEQVARAVALFQIGKRALAREELVRAHAHVDPALDQALIALASDFKLPAIELQVANAAYLPPMTRKGGRIELNAGLFPVPDYAPSTGYKVDRALLLAFMRQESKFQPDAMSRAGARGLMQIMPATASHIARDRSLAGANRDRLLDPTFNVTLGQDYLAELMDAAEPHGNLFMLTTAYNGGPGNLSRWLASIDFKGDPFLFIESIPAAETRGYIERVLTNYWIYSDRLGTPVGSLDASAAGTWPVYGQATGSLR